MRRLLVLLILLLLLAGTIYLSRALEDWHYIVPAEPGAVLYATGFETGRGWSLQDRRGSVIELEANALHIALQAANSRLVAEQRPYFDDFDLRVKARAVSGPVNNSFGVVFRRSDPDNYYVFSISSDGYYRLARVVDGAERELSVWIEATHIVRTNDAENTVRVVAEGAQFRFYVNGVAVPLCIPDDPTASSTYNEFTRECVDGQMLTAITDDTLPFGRVGVFAETLDNPDVRVAFDDFVVLGPPA